MSKIRTLKLLLLFIFLTVSGSSYSQSSAGQHDNDPVLDPVIIKANLKVLDADNNSVTDITPEDIKIYEDDVLQKITYFQRKEPLLNLGILIDNSGSLRRQLDDIIKLRKEIAEILVDGSELFMIRFIGSDKISILQDWTSRQHDVEEAFDQMYVEGGKTAVLDAIYLGFDHLRVHELAKKKERHAIILVSDVENRDSYYSYDQIINVFKDSDIQVFIISFSEKATKKKNARTLGNRLAFDTGGSVIKLSKNFNKQDIVAAFKEVMSELRSPFIIGYKSTNQKRDGINRKIRVEIADGKKGEKRFGQIRDSVVVSESK